MKTIIAGSRDFTDYRLVVDAIAASTFVITEVVSGGARGIDRLGEQWAEKNDLPCTIFCANWNQLGKVAGRVRNEQMAQYAEALIAIPGEGPGTRHMIAMAKYLGLHVFVYERPA